MNKLLNQEVGEGSKKRKLDEVAPDQEVEESDGSYSLYSLWHVSLLFPTHHSMIDKFIPVN
jgi:hypothetical protein